MKNYLKVSGQAVINGVAKVALKTATANPKGGFSKGVFFEPKMPARLKK